MRKSLLLLPCLIGSFLTAVATPLLATDTPTENQGANAMQAKVHDESNGLLRLVKFTKTNGQRSVVNGVEMYNMECSAEVVANEACAMTGFEFGGGWNGTFGALKTQKNATALDAFNPFGAASGTNKQLAKGAHMTFNTNLNFDLTERGWRTEGRLPLDTAFVAEDAPVAPALHAFKPSALSKMLIGKWKSVKNNLTHFQYLPDGTCTYSDQRETDARCRWYIENGSLFYELSGGRTTSKKVGSLTDTDLTLINFDGSTAQFVRISD